MSTVYTQDPCRIGGQQGQCIGQIDHTVGDKFERQGEEGLQTRYAGFGLAERSQLGVGFVRLVIGTDRRDHPVSQGTS